MATSTVRRPVRKSVRSAAALAAADLPAPDLRTFTADFFRLFGATVTPVDKRKQGPLQVNLPPDLAEFFGSDEIGLAFQTVEEGSGHQLVAHGSRTFDRMLAWLEQRSALTVRRLPVRHAGSEALLGALRPANAGIANLRLQEQQEPIYAFHWRITYRADDKREELYTVVLDDQGTLLSSTTGARGAGDPAAGSDPAPFERWLADSEPLPDEPPDADGLIPGPRLPPMTQLVRMAETARKFAVYHADTRCVAHEAEILPRLYKTLNRLTTYYGQQMEEVREGNDPQGDKRALLESDLERKIAEEVENHRLRVRVDLVGYAVLYLPAAVADMTLSDGKAETRLRVRLDRYTGALQPPACHACGQPIARAVLCRNGHACCAGCLRQCATCGDVLCAACGTLPCPVCLKENCERCGADCRACGERACAVHVERCPTCGDIVCLDCQSECAACGTRQCRSHLRADAVLDAGESARLICGRCAVRCPGCNQYSARLGTCSLSGQRFCANCLVQCSDCGRTVGPGFYGVIGGAQAAANGNGQRRYVCRDCVVLCPGCGEPALELGECATCGGGCCESCSRTCSVCGDKFCREHSEIAPGCGHVLCRHHAQTCHIGGEAVCPRCNESCAICEQHACTHHQVACTWCGKLYCSKCVHERSGLCLTCASLMRHGERVDILKEPCATAPDVAALAGRYLWKRAQNRSVTVYLGSSTTGSVLAIVRALPGGKSAIVTRRLTPRDLVAGAFHL